METFSVLLALCVGNSLVPVNSPHKGQWRGALMFSLICAWINDWVNNRQAGDLRHHCGHYGVNEMYWIKMLCLLIFCRFNSLALGHHTSARGVSLNQLGECSAPVPQTNHNKSVYSTHKMYSLSSEFEWGCKITLMKCEWKYSKIINLFWLLMFAFNSLRQSDTYMRQ